MPDLQLVFVCLGFSAGFALLLTFLREFTFRFFGATSRMVLAKQEQQSETIKNDNILLQAAIAAALHHHQRTSTARKE